MDTQKPYLCFIGRVYIGVLPLVHIKAALPASATPTPQSSTLPPAGLYHLEWFLDNRDLPLKKTKDNVLSLYDIHYVIETPSLLLADNSNMQKSMTVILKVNCHQHPA